MFSSVSFADAIAFSTTSASATIWLALPIDIFLSEGVPPKAVGFCGVASLKSITPKQVDSQSNRIKVGGVYARFILARMIQSKPFWNRTDQLLISIAMRSYCHFSNGEFAVAPFVFSGYPNPAATLNANF